MRYSNTLLEFKMTLLMPLLAILFTACGSYQQSSYYDNDGIYGETEPVYRNQDSYSNTQRTDYPKQNPQDVNNDAVLYENYFGQKAQQYEEMLNNSDAVFTDIDGYSSLTLQDSLDIADAINYRYENGYAGWGDNPQTTSINIYSNNGWGLGWNNWGWNNWGWNRWNNWGWNNWGWGGYNPYWGPGWGWGGFYGPGWAWGWNNWGWNNWGWNGWAYNNYWYNGWNRSYARTNSRRGYYSRNAVAGRSGVTGRNGYTRSRNSTYSRSYSRNGYSRSRDGAYNRSYNRNGVSRRNYSRGYSNSANIGARGRGRTPGAVRSSGRNYRQNNNGGGYRSYQRGNSSSGQNPRYSGSRNSSPRSGGSVRSSGGGGRSSGGSVRSSGGGGRSSGGGGGRGRSGGRGRN